MQTDRSVFIATAKEAAQKAFSDLADEKELPKDAAVERMRECRAMSTMLLLELHDQGINTKPDARGSTLVDEHRYLTSSVNGEEIIIDPTWQQFLPVGPINPDLPRVLIGNREEAVEIARKAGVPNEALHIWEPYSPEHPDFIDPDSVARGSQVTELFARPSADALSKIHDLPTAENF